MIGRDVCEASTVGGPSKVDITLEERIYFLLKVEKVLPHAILLVKSLAETGRSYGHDVKAWRKVVKKSGGAVPPQKRVIQMSMVDANETVVREHKLGGPAGMQRKVI